MQFLSLENRHSRPVVYLFLILKTTYPLLHLNLFKRIFHNIILPYHQLSLLLGSRVLHPDLLCFLRKELSNKPGIPEF